MPGLPFTFKNPADVFAALDGDLGDHIRADLLAKGIYAFRRGFDNGFHQLTTSTKPIRTVDDLVGMKIRTPVQKMTVDFFESLGAKPMTFTLNRLYEVLKDHTVDAQTDPLQIIVLLKLNEVQTYLSLTNHWWSGFTLVANAQAWKALPPDIQAVIERHAAAAALAQRQDVERLDAGAVEWLRGKGMIVRATGFRVDSALSSALESASLRRPRSWVTIIPLPRSHRLRPHPGARRPGVRKGCRRGVRSMTAWMSGGSAFHACAFATSVKPDHQWFVRLR